MKSKIFQFDWCKLLGQSRVMSTEKKISLNNFVVGSKDLGASKQTRQNGETGNLGLDSSF